MLQDQSYYLSITKIVLNKIVPHACKNATGRANKSHCRVPIAKAKYVTVEYQTLNYMHAKTRFVPFSQDVCTTAAAYRVIQTNNLVQHGQNRAVS